MSHCNIAVSPTRPIVQITATCRGRSVAITADRRGPQGAPGPPGSGNYQLIPYDSSGTYTLSLIAASPEKSRLFINGAKQQYGIDYVIDGALLIWTSSNLPLSGSDSIEIFY